MFGRDSIAQAFGLFVELNLFTPGTVYVNIAVGLIGPAAGVRMYRYSLTEA
jgi:hypothetical protein